MNSTKNTLGDKHSLRKRIFLKLYNILNRMLYNERKYFLLEAFNLWRNKTIYNAALRPFHPLTDNKRISRNKFACDIIPKSQWQKSAARQIIMVIYNYYLSFVRISFQQWKSNIKHNNKILFYAFYQWNLWFSARKLNRMNALKFMKLMKKHAQQYLCNMKYLAWKRWVNYVDWYRSTIRVRLLLRLWKYYTIKVKEEKKKLVLPFKKWFDITNINKDKNMEKMRILSLKCSIILSKKVINYFFKCYKISSIIKKNKFLKFRALRKWKDVFNFALSTFGSTNSSNLFLHANFHSPKSPNKSMGYSSNSMILSPSSSSPRKKLLNHSKFHSSVSSNSMFLSPVNDIISDNANSKKRKQKPAWVNILDKDPLTHFKSAIPSHRYDCKCYNCRKLWSS